MATGDHATRCPHCGKSFYPWRQGKQPNLDEMYGSQEGWSPMPSERGMVCLMGEHAIDSMERDDPYYCRQCGRYLPYDFTIEDLEYCDCICPVCKALHVAVGFTRGE